MKKKTLADDIKGVEHFIDLIYEQGLPEIYAKKVAHAMCFPHSKDTAKTVMRMVLYWSYYNEAIKEEK